MASYLTDFTSQTHGFGFDNRFRFPFPITYELPYAGEVKLKEIAPGLSGGMCYSALDYFTARQQVPPARSSDDLSDRFLTFLSERHLDSLSLPNVLKVIEWTMIDAREVAERTSRLEIPRLLRWLRRGTPAALVLIRRSGVSDQAQNTIVLASGMELASGSRRAEITLYDPDRPGETPLLTMQRIRGAGRVVFRESTGEEVLGFFLLPYAPRRVPEELQLALSAVPFDVSARLPFALQWPVDSRRVNQYFNVNAPFYRPFGLPGHEGLDLYANTGANIYAAADGEVTQANAPKNHPYGLQVRIRHTINGKSFQTIYAHLSKVFVAPGQQVQAGQTIALADNTGNSFGAHLHFTLKIDGDSTPGFPAGIVDPFDYLQDEASAATTQPVELPPPCGITVFTLLDLNLRSGPGVETAVTAGLPSGERLAVLGNAGEARKKIGVQGAWLQVQTANGTPGYVAAWYVQDTAQAFPPSDLVVYPDDTINLRSGPGTTFSVVTTLEPTAALTVLGDSSVAHEKLGKQNEWLQVQSADGKRGFAAAWLVHATGQMVPASGLVVVPSVQINVRARPGTDANILSVAAPGDRLSVLGNREQAASHLGVEGEWLQVQTPNGFHGYVAAWLVRLPDTTTPQPAPTGLPVYPLDGINVRAQASTNAPRLFGALKGEMLTLFETDLAAAKAKVGQPDTWLFVENKNGQRGWAAAWFLSLKPV